jgi:hypothetical protein
VELVGRQDTSLFENENTYPLSVVPFNINNVSLELMD